MERWFEQNGWATYMYGNAGNGGEEPSAQHLRASELCDLIPRVSDMPKFALVRHPVARAISEWKWHRWILRRTELDFSSFLRWMSRCVVTRPQYWDNHWRPQSDLLDIENIEVIKLEEAARLKPYLHSIGVQLRGELPRENSAGGTRSSFGGSRPTLDASDLSLIRAIYAIDFQRFGYCDEM